MNILPKLVQQFDLIFVDPPYIGVDKGYGSFLMDWFPYCYHKLLKDTGTLIFTTGGARLTLKVIGQFSPQPNDIWIYDKRGSGKPYYWKDSPTYLTDWLLDWHKTTDRYLDRNILPTALISNLDWNQLHLSWHPTPKNIDLMRRLVEGLCPIDGWVLDPFLGSGTTLVACKELSRNGIGIELNETYAHKCRERIKKTKVQQTIEAFM